MTTSFDIVLLACACLACFLCGVMFGAAIASAAKGPRREDIPQAELADANEDEADWWKRGKPAPWDR